MPTATLTDHRRRGRPAPRPVPAPLRRLFVALQRVPRFGVPELFLIAQTILPALLFLPGTQPLRLPIRVLPYLLSLALLVWHILRKSNLPPAPAGAWLAACCVWFAAMMAHPDTSFVAGAAQATLSIAVFAPLFWAPGLVKNPAHLRRLLWVLLLCNGLNAAVGVMQVVNPDRWLPKEFSTVNKHVLGYKGAAGREVVRPPGLFDTPGAVSGPAAVAALLGAILATTSGVKTFGRVVALGFAFCGLAAIYLSHVRSSFIVVLGTALVYAFLVLLQRRAARALWFGGLAVGMVAGALAFAVMLGGEEVFKRFASLLEDDPTSVYMKNRGAMLRDDFTAYLFDYPIGAGLGRWGMMRYYFGREAHVPSLWAEIQPIGWLLDGGLPLLLFSLMALYANTMQQVWLSKNTRLPGGQLLAAAVTAVNLGTSLLILSFVPFASQVGLQYWFLSGALHGAVVNPLRAAAGPPPQRDGP